MKKWNYKVIDFSDCKTMLEAIEKYVMYREITPVEYLPYLDWHFFYNGIYDLSVDVSYDYFIFLRKLNDLNSGGCEL